MSVSKKKWLTCCLSLAVASLLLPVAVSAQDDEAAVRAVIDGLVAGINAGDLEAALSYYADDATVMPPQQPGVEGKDALREGLEEYLSANKVHSEAEILDVGVNGDLAHVRATYHDTLTNADGQETHNTGNWLLVLKKGEVGWKITSELWALSGGAS